MRQQLKLNLPADVKAFLAGEAAINGSSQNSEVIRSIRERMAKIQATAGESLQADTPAVASDEPALEGGPINTSAEGTSDHA